MIDTYTNGAESATTFSPILAAALHLASVGWTIFPAPPGEKKSYKSAAYSDGRPWGATKDAGEIRRDFDSWPDANIGMPTGAVNCVFVVDIDRKNDKDGFASLAALEAEHGELPDTLQVESPSGSIHYYFRWPGFPVITKASPFAPGIDVRGDGGMVIAPPSVKPGAGAYKWRNSLAIADAPAWLLDLVRASAKRERVVGTAIRAPADLRPVEGTVAARVLATAYNAVLTAENGTRNQTLNTQSFVVGRYVGSGEIGADVATDNLLAACVASGLIDEDGERQCRKTIESGLSGGMKEPAVTFAGVVAQIASPPLAPGELPPCPAPLPAARVMPRGGTLMGPRGEVLPIDSDDCLALDFTDQHVGELRHCEEWGKWLRWDGIRWKQDKTSGAYNLVRLHLRRVGSGMHLQDARKILSAKTVAAVERMAKTDPRIATAADIWDPDPWLLNTPGGVVDLRTCVIREGQPGDHMTKITAVAPGGDCPMWKAFLHKSLAGDVELISFVQRMFGYSLTGSTKEQVLFFLHGQGGNGKGVLLNTAASILADYAKTAPMATFTDSANAADRHPTDLAGLRGARFVMASETEKSRKWAEAKIKSLTGGDPISARFMGRDFFEYVPTFKLVIAGNHKPRLGTVDEAIKRRMNMIPFTVQIPAAERDTALPEKLRAEWGGILQWMVEGCLAWQRDGLQPPAAVRTATDEYLSSQDALATWLDERCEQAPDAWAARTGLFASWSAWALGAREPIGNASEFYQALSNKGFPEHKRGDRGFRGLRLRPFATAMPPVPER